MEGWRDGGMKDWRDANPEVRGDGNPLSVLFFIFLLFLAEFSNDKYQKSNKYEISKFQISNWYTFVAGCVRHLGRAAFTV
jgi:hypothetical protein